MLQKKMLSRALWDPDSDIDKAPIMDMPEDIAREEWFEDIRESIAAEAISEFALDRLRSYYVKNPRLAVDVFAIFKEAKLIYASSPTAALVLYTTAIEVALKTTVLKPVIYGLVHNESIAELVSDLVVKNNGIDRFKEILSTILSQYSGYELNDYMIDGHQKLIWDEISMVQKARNAVVHRAAQAPPEMAALSKDVAVAIIVNFFQGVLNRLGLELQKDGEIIA